MHSSRRAARPLRPSCLVSSLVFVLACVVSGGALAAAAATDVLPKPPAAFKGKVAADRDQSTPDWPTAPTAAKGAPNVVVILLDDVGFGSASAFGGAAQTPALDSLAQTGLKYNTFHVNSLCSPTRAALLTGRNDHQVGFGVTTAGYGYPGYNTVWKPEYASVAEVLRQNGYSTAAFGKWHNTPVWEISPVGPFDRWPTKLGFEYFYGFQGGADNQFLPRLYRNTEAVEPAQTPGYHFTTDIANDAIRWFSQHDAVAADKPFFLYFAPGATHTPHHVPPEWIAKYKGKFDQGWDKLREETFARQQQLGVIPANAKLTPRPAELPAWDSLPADERALLARQQEIWAAFLSHTDYEVGRVLQAIRDAGQWDNTLVFYIVGDNGASAEGGLQGQDARTGDGKPETVANRLKLLDDLGGERFPNHYAAAWAWANNAPFQWTKQVASHLGGTRVPLVVNWPAKIQARGDLRTQFQHVTDIAPTIYDVAKIRFPQVVNGVRQAPLEGQSLAQTFNDAKAPSRHRTQYFEMVGNRGIYQDGWWAGARHLLPWDREKWDQLGIGQHAWELYNLDEDFSQANDLAQRHPEKLKALQALFEREAKRNDVYPLAPHRTPLPSAADGRKTFVYRAGVDRIPANNAPNVSGRAHVITADIEVPASGAKGVLIAEGGRNGGFSLFVEDGRVVYEANAFGAARQRIVSSEPLPPGKARISFEFAPDGAIQGQDVQRGWRVGAGTGRLTVNGKPAGEARFAHFGGFSSETLDVGKDLGSPVSEGYAVPFAFNGKLEKVSLELK